MNVKRYVLLFNIFFLLLLIAATFLFEWKPTIAGENLRPIDILADIKKDTLQNKFQADNVAITTKLNKGNIAIRDYNSYDGLINASGEQFALKDFMQKLADLKRKKRKKIRIAFFGDSMIEGDLITEDVRKQLQDIFGGSGVGFVPITSIVAGFRTTVIHSFSDNWMDENFKSADRAGAKLFISGHSFFGDSSSWVNYKPVNRPHLNSFSNVSVLYGMPASGKNNSATLTVNGKQQAITANESFNVFDTKVNAKDFTLGISSADIPLYGTAFESDSGIVIDNFSFRGITGVELHYFTDEFLKQIQKTRPYDLLVFEYGPNILFRPNLTDFSWYERQMMPTLKKIRAAFPQTSILVISTADHAFNYQGEWHSAKGIQSLVNVQYDMAQKINADFLNLYKGMGGQDAIVEWVQGDTVYANKDYTHVNFRGAKRLADIIFNAIMKEYDDFEKHTDQ